MKLINYIASAFAGAILFTSCEKHEAAPAGQSDLEHHYYAIFVPNNNTGITVSRSQTALIKLPVQFYSTFTRSYDAVAVYSIAKFIDPVTTPPTVSNPAVRGVDYNIVDRNGVTIPTPDSTYRIVFPQAKQAMDTIYVKLLNNTTPGVRKFEVQMRDNITAEYDVDIFSTAFRRPITIN